MRKTIFKAAFSSVCFFVLFVSAGFSEQYFYMELPYVGQGYWSNEGDAWVAEINDNGQVTGTTREIGGDFLVRAFLWSEEEGLLLLENLSPGEGLTRGHAVNNSGQVVGYGISAPPSLTTPLVWSEGQGARALKLLPGYNQGSADSINAKGEITGAIWQGYTGPSKFVVWKNPESEPTLLDIGPFDYISNSAISNGGTIAGQGYDVLNIPSAFRWTRKDGTQVLTPPYLPGDVAGGAFDLNENGAIVGYSQTDWETYNAVIWKGGTITDAGSIDGRRANIAYGINNSKKVVGASFDYVEDPSGTGMWIPGNGRAFVWTEKLQMKDLNGLVVNLPEGVQLLVAVDINSQGQIVVEGLNNTTGKTVFAVLTPF